MVAVTGTNGKTTTSRMIAHIARTSGLLVGWSNTDGIYIDGELVEAGDYSGPSGAGRVLAHPEVQLAVTETARGGILLKGIGLTRNDVSVVTNVTADHLGLQGIDTVDQLAEVKAVVPKITRKERLGGPQRRRPAGLRDAATTKASPGSSPATPTRRRSGRCSRPAAAGPRPSSTAGCRVLAPDADADPLVELVDVPMTLAGLSRFNVENTLAAASAALAIGIPRDKVVEGLRTFRPDAEHNPGRMNFFSLPGDFSVVLDLAHNEAGLEAMLEIMNGVRRPGAPAAPRARRGRRPAGRPARQARRDRGPRQRRGGHRAQAGLPARPHHGGDGRPAQGRGRAGRRHRHRVVPHRGGVPGGPGRAGPARRRGGPDVPRRARGRNAWIAEHGGTPDTPDTLTAKVRAARA